jgi:hypothetical protein
MNPPGFRIRHISKNVIQKQSSCSKQDVEIITSAYALEKGVLRFSQTMSTYLAGSISMPIYLAEYPKMSRISVSREPQPKSITIEEDERSSQ